MPENLRDLSYYVDLFAPKVISFLLELILALVVFWIGKKIIRGVLKLFNRIFTRAGMELSVSGFLNAVIRTGLYILLIMAITEVIGIGASAIIALVGSAGLTLGLAFQGSLSNFAGGVLIILMKPFKVGDFIIAGNDSGTVSSIDIFYTRIITPDNRMTVIPNGTLTNMSLINVTSEPVRRLDLVVSVDYSENIQKVKHLLAELAMEEERILKDRDIDIFVNNFDPSAISIGFRIWTLSENYWPLKWHLLERIKEKFDENNITIPFDQLDVNLVGQMSEKPQ
ncbi:mechanosensitive ion channel family protein [Anaerolentibacter hominis]|uniref:mechanosensitive ion channel family protein n=1 Tax=Anaerolentibacter hominis TaxID=3079009 RepID=UPI0031B80DBD